MIENGFSIKEASKLLNCSTQNIYQQKSKLLQDGYMEQDKITGGYFINEKGINYLREKRIETMKANNQGFNQVDKQDFKGIATPTVSTDNTEYINMLKEQINDLKKDRDYWKNEFIRKDNELKDKNEYIQGMSTKMFALLDTAEGNKKQEEKNKKGFFKKIFS